MTCAICNREITDDDIKAGNFNESLGEATHQSCYDCLGEESDPPGL